MTEARSALAFADDLQALADELLELESTGEEARAAGGRLAHRIERRIAELFETRPDGADHALARPAWVAAELLRDVTDNWPTEGAVPEERLWEMRALLLASLVPNLDEVSLGLPRMGRWSSWREAPNPGEDKCTTFSSRAGILSFAGFVDESDDERTRGRQERLLAVSKLTVRQLRRHLREAPAPPLVVEPSKKVRPEQVPDLDGVEGGGLTPEALEILLAVYELGAKPRSRMEVAAKQVAFQTEGQAVDERVREKVRKRLQRLRKRGFFIANTPGFRLSLRGEAAVLKRKDHEFGTPLRGTDS